MITSKSKVLFNLFMIHDPHHWSKIPSKTISGARLFYRLDNFHVNQPTTQDLSNQSTNHIHPPTHTHIIVMASKWQFSQINFVCQLPLTTTMWRPYPFRSHNIKSEKAQWVTSAGWHQEGHPAIDWLTDSLSLPFHFNGHFPGEPGLAGVYWSKGWWKRWWQLEL